MRTICALATTILCLLFLAAAPAYSQDDSKPSQQQEEKDKGKDKEKAGKPDKAAKPDEVKPGQEQPAAQPPKDEKRKQNENRQPEASRPQEQSSGQPERGHSQHPVQAQRGNRIPDQKFRASFGRQHTFHVQREQIVNNPQPLVVYGGYSFVLVDAWPTVWAFDDVVYVDFVDDEYFLFDPLYPSIRVALVVVE